MSDPNRNECSYSEKPNSSDTISRHAAIRWIKTECNPYGKPTLDYETSCRIMEHLDKMPSAQPEPCGDSVSREVVQSIAEKSDWFESSDSFNDFMWALYELPSVTPKRKTGKWNFIGDQMFECTECGTCYTQNQFHQMMVRITDPEFPNFCPNCGADMRGEQDERHDL